ncbi:uncharacterized protein LOC143287635 [Babylonia areolata]|uniref:uncharacterized protein LOC143287635 n=1 Tax=Babylonia areolata TaxID=304850 RepID=UPI003FD3D53B
MEVLYRNQPVFGAQPAAMVYPSANCPSLSSPMFSTPSQPYTCYSFQASPSTTSPHPPSRTPTPEYPCRSRSNQESMMNEGTPNTATTTLKSVLRGEVPEAYSHFMSSSPPGSEAAAGRQSHSPLGKRKCPFVEVETPSCCPGGPFLGRGSTTVLSPPPEDVQTEPMDLSFKRPSSASSSDDAAASSPASFHHTFPPSPAEDHQGHSSEFSLLRNLLQVGKTLQPPSSSPFHSASPTTSSSSSANSDRSCDSPCSSESGYPTTTTTRHLCGSTRVTLAKKNMYPVSARVSDWLVKVVQFAHSVSCFREDLTPGDQFTLLLNSWSRLLLLFMAESNFQFVVTPLRTDPSSVAEGSSGSSEAADCLPSPDEPTMKSVEAIQTFIRKCQHMGVESEEYHYLRMLVLFNSGNAGVNEAAKVDGFNSQIQKSLQQHVHSTRPRDVMHYSRLLMCLPSLYGISANMVERLFCRHIDRTFSSPSSCCSSTSASTTFSMGSLLKELMRNMDR